MAQLVYTLVTFIITPFVYVSYALHLVYSLAIGTIGVQNGAEYYMEVFSKRYITSVEKKHTDTKARLEKRALARQAKRDGKPLSPLSEEPKDRETAMEERQAELRAKCD